MGNNNPCCYDSKVPYVIYPYDPQDKFTQFRIPTLWINKTTNEVFILTGIMDGKAIWEKIEIPSNIIDSIVIDGATTIEPINGVIEFLSGDGITITKGSNVNQVRFAIKSPIDPSIGGTGFGTYANGDLLVGTGDGKLKRLPKGAVGKVLGINSAGELAYIDVICNTKKPGSNQFIRASSEGCLTGSKTTQTDDGNTSTIVNKDTDLLWMIENQSNNTMGTVTHMLKTKEGEIFREWIVEGKQIYSAYLKGDNTLCFYGKELPEGSANVGDIQIIEPNGIVKQPHMQRFSAQLPHRSSPTWTKTQIYFVGTNFPFDIIRDEDGFNKKASNFFPGNSTTRAYFTCPHDGDYKVSLQFMIDAATPNAGVSLFIYFGKNFENYQRLYFYQNTASKNVVSMDSSLGLPLLKGDRVWIGIEVLDAADPGPKILHWGGEYADAIQNFWGMRYLG